MKKFVSLMLVLLMLVGTMIGISSAVFAEESLTLAENSHLTLDRESGYLRGIDGTVTVGELLSEFVCAAAVAGKSDSDPVASEDVITCGDDSIRAIIYGDVDCDGSVTVSDVIVMLQRIAGWDVNFCAEAIDVDADSDITVSDAIKTLKKVAGWSDISLGCVRMVYENCGGVAEAEDDAIDMYFADAMLKLGRSNVENTGNNSYKMKLAKNESESCQMILASTEDREDLTFSITPFVSEWGDCSIEPESFIEFYYNLSVFNDALSADINNYTQDYYPDPLLPTTAPFSLSAGKSQGFMISITTPKDAPAGMYKATIEIKNAEGKVVKTAPLYAYVWDFALPDGPYSASAFGLTMWSLAGATGLGNADSDTLTQMYKQYYDFLLDYNITGSALPYEIYDDRANEYLDDPRVTSVCVNCDTGGLAYSNLFGDPIGEVGNKNYDVEAIKAKLVRCFDKLRQKPEWNAKHYICGIDEPYDHETLRRIGSIHDWIEEVVGPEFNMMLCYAQNPVYDKVNFMDGFEFASNYVDTWCPQSVAFTERSDNSPGISDPWYSARSQLTYGSFINRYNAERSRGKGAWWYVCISPGIPYANYFIYYQGINNRVLLWQQYMFDIDGILYWDTTYNLENVSTRRYMSASVYGDGHLLYCGRPFGYGNDPLPSFRLIQVRDSFDDFDYLHIAEELYGRDEVMKTVGRVTTAILKYTEDASVLQSARDELAEMILAKRK